MIENIAMSNFCIVLPIESKNCKVFGSSIPKLNSLKTRRNTSTEFPSAATLLCLFPVIIIFLPNHLFSLLCSTCKFCISLRAKSTCKAFNPQLHIPSFPSYLHNSQSLRPAQAQRTTFHHLYLPVLPTSHPFLHTPWLCFIRFSPHAPPLTISWYMMLINPILWLL